MTKRLFIFILTMLLALSFVILTRCGGAPSTPSGDGGNGGNGEEVAKWGTAIWDQSKWNPDLYPKKWTCC